MADDVNEVVYRWHQIMFRLDEMDEIVESGVTEDEASNFETERQMLRRELEGVEARLGLARVARLRAAHEADSAYARLARQMEEEKEE